MKVCSLCKISKDEDSFRFRNISAGLRHVHCKECVRSYGKEFYKIRRKSRISLSAKRVRELRLKNIKKFVRYLLDHPCVDCGEKDPIVLDFDHVFGKKRRSVSSTIAYSWDVIQEEISKCVVRCANCHRRKTSKQFSWVKISVIEEMRRNPID